MNISSPNADAEGRIAEQNQTPPTDLGRYHPQFGRATPRLGWVPAPRYLLRRDLVLRAMRALPRGRVLEVGCGAGALLEDLCYLGFQCEALETSSQALAIARQILKPWSSARFNAQPARDWAECFDFVVSFEVLEHVADDQAMLSRWASWLRPDGMMILSVPAHMRRWSAHDEWAGHVRRYERSDLMRLFEVAGLRILRLENYGFPIGNIAGLFRRSVHAAGAEGGPVEISERTARSGVERSTEVQLWPFLSSFPGVMTMRLGMILQRLFLAREFGDGYLVIGRRR